MAHAKQPRMVKFINKNPFFLTLPPWGSIYPLTFTQTSLFTFALLNKISKKKIQLCLKKKMFYNSISGAIRR